MKLRILSAILIVTALAGILAGCQPAATPTQHSTPTTPATPTTPGSISQEASQLIALEYLQNSATYQFDGIDGSIKLVDVAVLRCPSCWTFSYEFDSASAGYGDRSALQVATMVTPHTAEITLNQGQITSAMLDRKWDMRLQMMIMTQAEGEQIARDFLLNSPTFKFDGIESSVKLVEVMSTFCPYCWGYAFDFDCAQAGYGDRSDMMLAQVITPHRIVIGVSGGQVDGAAIDGAWDELHQENLKPSQIATASVGN